MNKTVKFAKALKKSAALLKAVLEDSYQYAKNSDILGWRVVENLEAVIIATCHGIDKGLTIPKSNKRNGYGKDKVGRIVNYCEELSRLKPDSFALRVAACTLKDYVDDPCAEPEAVILASGYLERRSVEIDYPAASVVVPKSDYDRWAQSDLDGFFLNRSSTRYFDPEPPSGELVLNSVRLAFKTPSACNRQGWKVFQFEGRKAIGNALSHQTGSSDFRGEVPGLFLVCGDQSASKQANERHQPRIDASMLAMSLIYTLRRNGLASVPLNCSLSPEAMRAMCKDLKIEDRYLPVMFIAFGKPLDESVSPLSPRKPLKDVFEQRA